MASDPRLMSGTSYAGERLSQETWPDQRASPRSVFGAPLCPNLDALSADVAFLGIPIDQATGVTGGARFAPDAIRDTRSYQYFGPDGDAPTAGYYDIDSDSMPLQGVTMADCGNISIVPSDVERNYWKVTRVVRRIVERGALLVAIGGDHSVTPAVVRGFDAYPALDLLHFDAHLDFGDHVQTSRWTSGTPIRRCSEFPWVRQITQIGMRMTRQHDIVDAARARGNIIVTSEQFFALGPEAAIALVPESDALYVSFDIDILDPTCAMGTQGPEPGGLNYFEMRAALRALAKRCNVVGMDLVEIAPPLDPTHLTVKTATKLLVDFLTAIFDQRDGTATPTAVAGATG